MRCFVMFVTAVCVLVLLKLTKWLKNKSFYADSAYSLSVKTAKKIFINMIFQQRRNSNATIR